MSVPSASATSRGDCPLTVQSLCNIDFCLPSNYKLHKPVGKGAYGLVVSATRTLPYVILFLLKLYFTFHTLKRTRGVSNSFFLFVFPATVYAFVVFPATTTKNAETAPKSK